ncbi:hypothetical protein D6833_04075, partial [Candidatus Parcubacteria bacterium]
HLPESLLADALHAARGIEIESHRAEALAALAPHLPEEEWPQVLAQALAAARSIRNEDDRARALAALAPHLPESLLADALHAARSIRDEDDRARALAALAPHLAQLSCATLYSLWAGDNDSEGTLAFLAQRTRRDLLSDLRALQEVILALGGEAAVAETARAIMDVGRWWP